MERGNQPARSHLLLLRMWSDDRTDAQGEWSARLQYVFTGEARTFRACPQLVDLLLELLAANRQTKDKE